MVGIYKITSPTGRVYIGQSWHILKRFNSHVSNSNNLGKKGSYPICSSIRKYGFDNHKADIIHELPLDVSQNTMDLYEQLYIELYKNAGAEMLNLTEGGRSGKRSKETKKKMSDSGKGKVIKEETRRKISQKLTGKKQPVEVKIKRGKILRELKRKVTDEHKLILSKSLMGNERNNHPIILTDINTGDVLYFDTVKKAAIHIGSIAQMVARYLHGFRKRSDGSIDPNSKYSKHIFKGYKITSNK